MNMTLLSKNLREREQGIGLILVLVISVVLAGLAAFTIAISLNASQVNAQWEDLSQEGISCESVSDLLRNELVNDLRSSGLNAADWLAEVRDGTRFNSNTPKTFPGFPGVEGVVEAVSPAGSGSLWIDIKASTDINNNETDQGVIQRIRIGSSSMMEFAMLTKNTNCMFCHMKIKGDVGSLADLMPGWGAENSGAGSSIDGNVYVAGQAIEGTGAHTGTINGTDVTGTIYEDHVGSKLPEDTDGDGEPDFPALDPVVAAQKATGSIWAGDTANSGSDGSGVWVTPLLGDWDGSVTGTVTSIPSGSTGATWKPASNSVLSSTIEGNLTLIGTDANPIQLNGDIFVTGDVVIKGKVSGKGAIYAGRNVYIAGDLVYANAPTSMDNDADAIAAIAANKDELRLAARSNIVMGDWTYMEDDGTTIQRMRDRQGQAFMTSSMDLKEARYFQAASNGTSSNELQLVNGTYYDDQGNVVPSAQVVTVNDSDELGFTGNYAQVGDADLRATIKPDNFDSLLAPGQVQSDGSIHRWMDQSEFRSILGTKAYSDMMYRYPTTDDDDINVRQLGDGGEDIDLMPDDTSHYDDDFYGSAGEGRYVKKTNVFTYAIETGEKQWPTQVTRVDAFLYSNKRITGLTPMVNGLVINGGMVSEEIQVLAPGRGNMMNWATPSTYGDPSPTTGLSFQDTTTPNEHGDLMDSFYLNFDYRLRNGGLGYNLIANSTGDRVMFRRLIAGES